MTKSFEFSTAEPLCSVAYLTAPIVQACREAKAVRVLDLGCGNGSLTNILSGAGFEVVGCDPSSQGINLASAAYPHIKFHCLAVEDGTEALGKFDAVVSTEVIEHLYSPRNLPRFASQVLSGGGRLILSTPYHGWLKNVFIAATNHFDAHVNPLWDGGHVKFWSHATLGKLLEEEGFSVEKFSGAGRLPYLWKSMICVARKR